MTIKCPKNTFLKKYLADSGYHLPTSCGGRGNCGKCVVRITEGEVPVNTMDRMWFTEEQLSQGYRLGCQVYTKEEISLEL